MGRNCPTQPKGGRALANQIVGEWHYGHPIDALGVFLCQWANITGKTMNKKEFGYAYDDAKRQYWRKKRNLDDDLKNGEKDWEGALGDSAYLDRVFINELTTLIVNYLGVNYEKA